MNLDRQSFQSFSPSRMETVQQRNKAKSVSRPLFPGYLFVQFDPTRNGWQAINSTRGISRVILGNIRRPTPLPAHFMAGLMARCNMHDILMAPQDLQAGDRIRILSGPFADIVTKIEQVDDGDRLGILIDLMGREVRTSIPQSIAEKLNDLNTPSAATHL
jgi:transcriptional antiterminator RfaH